MEIRRRLLFRHSGHNDGRLWSLDAGHEIGETILYCLRFGGYSVESGHVSEYWRTIEHFYLLRVDKSEEMFENETTRRIANAYDHGQWNVGIDRHAIGDVSIS